MSTQYPHVTTAPSDETRAALAAMHDSAQATPVPAPHVVDQQGQYAPPADVLAPEPAGEPQPSTPGAIARVLLPADDGTPDVEWADLRDPKQLRARDRKNILRKVKGDGPGGFAVDMTDGIVALLVVAWSLPYPVPSVRVESLGDLTFAQENALQAHPLVGELANLVQGTGSPLDASKAADPESPTVPSAG